MSLPWVLGKEQILPEETLSRSGKEIKINRVIIISSFDFHTRRQGLFPTAHMHGLSMFVNQIHFPSFQFHVNSILPINIERRSMFALFVPRNMPFLGSWHTMKSTATKRGSVVLVIKRTLRDCPLSCTASVTDTSCLAKPKVGMIGMEKERTSDIRWMMKRHPRIQRQQ